jgi:2-polyprenyl-3-methyl-5-hydroxy-6-metoxy-1,4-benzoquinol methylase
MGKEMGPSFYTGHGYLREGVYEVYLELYKTVISLLPSPSICDHILDLGCGVGYFAKTLKELGYTKYTGIDFSPKIIKYCNDTIEGYDFLCLNLIDKKTREMFNDYKIFTCLETLEHIKDDIKILKSIPKGSKIFVSVPSRDFTSHVRFLRMRNKL